MVPLFTSFELCEPQSALPIRHHLALGRDCVEMPVTRNSKGYVYLHNTATAHYLLLLHGGKSEGEVAHDGGVGGVLVEPEHGNITILSINILLRLT